MLRALDSGLPVAWVTGDEVYGGDYQLRVALEEREQPYAVTVKASQFLWEGCAQRQARTLVAAAACQCLGAAELRRREQGPAPV